MKKNYQATKTRSNRPGWSVTFKHPKRSDSRGRIGLKIRKGLGTQDESEADKLVSELNTLLSDEHWWSIDRRSEAKLQFSNVIISAFFDGMESGNHDSLSIREGSLPLPSRDEGYSKILFTGTTGAGKTTLLRQVIGTSHRDDRFPSTSTARTTTADIEIITADGPYEGAVTFMPEHEVRAHVDECIEEACLQAVEFRDEARVSEALLSHREQRFRLSYTLGAWRQVDNSDSCDDYDFGDVQETPIEVSEEEAVTTKEIISNQSALEDYVERIYKIAELAKSQTTEELELELDSQNPDDRSAWLEIYSEALYDQDDFSKLALDIMDDIQERFNRIEVGAFSYGSTGWPFLWKYTSDSRDKFLRQIRWFASNHHAQFGRLLTPLVDGVRVKGQFHPQPEFLKVAPKLILLDGEGIGHSAKAASSISTRITRRFSEVDMILLVDNAEQPMQSAPLELLRSVGSSGNASKVTVAFTHFDLVKGANLSNHQLKCQHVQQSVRDAIGTIRDSIGAPVANMLETQVETASYYLGGLDREIGKIPNGFVKELGEILEKMQNSAIQGDKSDLNPVYSGEGLEIALSDAVSGFREPWKARLGFIQSSNHSKEHWTRVKALAKRLALGWNNNEYDNLRPVSDMVARLQESISRWLDNPASWNRKPKSIEEQTAAIAPIRNAVFSALHSLAETRVADLHRVEWTAAYDFAGTGSSHKRAGKIQSIYEEAAPFINSAMSRTARSFLMELHRLVRNSVEVAGAKFGADNG